MYRTAMVVVGSHKEKGTARLARGVYVFTVPGLVRFWAIGTMVFTTMLFVYRFFPTVDIRERLFDRTWPE